eukprot:14861257-Ditylum_brightwellii.AAC.1
MMFDEAEQHATGQFVQMIVEQCLNGEGGWVIWVELLVVEEGCNIFCFGHWAGIMFSSVEGLCKQGQESVLLVVACKEAAENFTQFLVSVCCFRAQCMYLENVA